MLNQEDYRKSPTVACGQLDLWVAVTSAKREAVQALLPDDYELVPQDVTNTDEHPLMIVAGRQIDVHARLASEIRYSYLEAGILVPWVRCPAVTNGNVSLFRAELFLNSQLPVVLGRWLGIGKQPAAMACDKRSMTVATESAGPIFAGRFDPQSTFVRLARLSSYPLIRSLFEQVHVGHPLARKRLPTCCLWCNLNLSRAAVRLVKATMHVERRFCAALPGDWTIPAIREGTFGAFQLRTRWVAKALTAG